MLGTGGGGAEAAAAAAFRRACARISIRIPAGNGSPAVMGKGSKNDPSDWDRGFTAGGGLRKRAMTALRRKSRISGGTLVVVGGVFGLWRLLRS